jgi:nucleotide-binding universal stress UspA family protein
VLLIHVKARDRHALTMGHLNCELEGTMAAFKRILVPVDGSDTSKKALAAALELARDSNGRVRLLHAVDELAYVTGFEFSGDVVKIAQQAAANVLDEAKAIAEKAGVANDSKLIEFPGQRLGDTVAEEARKWEADLIVVGTHGRRGLGRVILGSGAEQIIRVAPIPVLTIRGEDAKG